MLKKLSHETCSAEEKDMSRILHKTAPAEKCQMLPWCQFSSSSLAHNSSHLQWPQFSVIMCDDIIFPQLVGNKTAREKSIRLLFRVTSNTTKFLAKLPTSTNSILSKFAFKYWDISIQKEGKKLKGQNSIGNIISFDFVVSIIILQKDWHCISHRNGFR